jgi:hypothetical protein
MQRSRLENSPERRRRSDESTEGPPPPPSSRPFVIAGLPLPPAKVTLHALDDKRLRKDIVSQHPPLDEA